ncbi:UNKNOWN [Stylonychia lemnae]|uniref:PX domain-containing protein n=1 Tax=Stylonychia lemnae TaxID=5949 RepID=A0A078AHK6_STYLE|nr:UNKNOWN [Stylonychia lemnae]|eukprot:CDW80977.1 UNKNOWN [Stylonychia lemnae]
MALFSENEFIFSFEQIEKAGEVETQKAFNEEELLEKDEQYYFSKDQYFSPVKRGVLEDIYNDALNVSSIFMNKTSLLQYVDKQFNTIVDQEVEQKSKALDSLYQTLSNQFPGFYVPKLSKRQKKLLQSGTPLEKRELVKNYIIRLSDYQYLIQHKAFKSFIEKKIEIKKHLSDPNSFGVEGDPIEVAERFRETFGYLMELQIKDQDIKIIDLFDQYIKSKNLELQQMKKELKTIKSKCVAEYKVEGKISNQKVTYQSFYYHLKTTAEVLGIKNREFMNLQINTQSQRIQSQRDEIQELMNYVDEEISELDVGIFDLIIIIELQGCYSGVKKVLEHQKLTKTQNVQVSRSIQQLCHFQEYGFGKSIIIYITPFQRRRQTMDETGLKEDDNPGSRDSQSAKQKKTTVEKLEDEMEQLSFENGAYETICQIMIANMATFDIEKFKAQRQKSYYYLISQLARKKLEDLKNGNQHFEHMINVLSM